MLTCTSCYFQDRRRATDEPCRSCLRRTLRGGEDYPAHIRNTWEAREAREEDHRKARVVRDAWEARGDAYGARERARDAYEGPRKAYEGACAEYRTADKLYWQVRKAWAEDD